MNTEQSSQSTPDLPAVGTRTIRAFLADDSPFNLLFLSRLLERDPRISIVGLATDGVHALRSLSHAMVHLVLVDLHMPGLDGVETAWRLKQLPQPPRVLLVTSDESPEARARAQMAGADGFLLKTPDLPAQLRTALQTLFENAPATEAGAAR